jgi:hypothetical protein
MLRSIAMLALSITPMMREANCSVVVMIETLGRPGSPRYRTIHAIRAGAVGETMQTRQVSRLFSCAHATAAVRDDTSSLA